MIHSGFKNEESDKTNKLLSSYCFENRFCAISARSHNPAIKAFADDGPEFQCSNHVSGV